MKILIKSAKIIEKSSPFNGQIKDILVEGGVITKIGDGLVADDATIYSANNLHVSAGWVDMRVASRDPGFEHKEDLTSVKAAASHGGFTEIVLLPNSSPVVHSKDTIRYILNSEGSKAVKLHIAAAVTRDAKGVDFTEMMDLHKAGAIAFTDGEHPVQNADLLLKSIQYLQPLNTLLINRPEDYYLALYGQMHEGITSTLIGTKGIPSLAEEMMVIRDLKLLAYALENKEYATDIPLLHFSLISTRVALELIREAKKQGLPVSCDVAAHQLAFTDADLIAFDTNLKVSPPFRSEDDRTAIKEALADGTIDAIVSDHNPHDEESKNLEFDHADFGITGLETAFSVAHMYTELSLESLIEKFTTRPRNILRIAQPVLDEGSKANLTLFAPEQKWVFDKTYSKSKNTPFLGKELEGKIYGVINQGESLWFS